MHAPENAVSDYARSVRASAALAVHRRLTSPKKWLGVRLPFEGGITPFVFRETAVRDARTDDPVVIVIQFRLAFLGNNRYLHAAFRRECILHTPLFAGFPGFRSKLWADDVETGVYAGVYEWQSSSLAKHYAGRMVALLTPFSNSGTARYQVIENLRRDDFLAGRGPRRDHDASAWWKLVETSTVRP